MEASLTQQLPTEVQTFTEHEAYKRANAANAAREEADLTKQLADYYKGQQDAREAAIKNYEAIVQQVKSGCIFVRLKQSLSLKHALPVPGYASVFFASTDVTTDKVPFLSSVV